MYQNNIFFILKKIFLKLIYQNNLKHIKKLFNQKKPKRSLNLAVVRPLPTNPMRE